MDWNGPLSLIYGLISGFTAFLPVSADAHKILLQELTGAEGNVLGFRLACHLAAFFALLLVYRPYLARYRRECRISRIPPKRRRRHPDQTTLKEVRFLRTACIPAVIVAVLCGIARTYTSSLWLLALLLALCGAILYAPQFFRTANKSAATVSALDALLIGAAGGIAPIPGLSGFAGSVAIGSLRGVDKSFATDMGILLFLAVQPVLICFDVYGIATLGTVFSGWWFFLYFLAAAAAFGGALLGIKLVRFLAVRVGFTGFSYYCWGLALFTFALYLMI